MIRVKSNAVLPDVAAHLRGAQVKMKQPGQVVSVVTHAGPPPKDWVINNELLDKGQEHGEGKRNDPATGVQTCGT